MSNETRTKCSSEFLLDGNGEPPSNDQHVPGMLYYGYVTPFVNMSVAGFVWCTRRLVPSLSACSESLVRLLQHRPRREQLRDRVRRQRAQRQRLRMRAARDGCGLAQRLERNFRHHSAARAVRDCDAGRWRVGGTQRRDGGDAVEPDRELWAF